jgi:uncharacterized membrane protein YsdA (DUF1294 family)
LKAHPYLAWVIIAAALIIGLGYLFYRMLGLDPLVVFLVSINLVTWLVYRYDKLSSARQGASRVPNLILAGLAVAGGSVGALVGIYAGRARHKTSPRYRPLRICVWLSLIVQAALLVAYLFGLPS